MCRKSGKFSIAYMAQGGEKEYYAASACEEIYVPPSGSLSLTGLTVAGMSELLTNHDKDVSYQASFLEGQSAANTISCCMHGLRAEDVAIQWILQSWGYGKLCSNSQWGFGLAWPAPQIFSKNSWVCRLWYICTRSCRSSKGRLYFDGVMTLPTCCAQAPF